MDIVKTAFTIGQTVVGLVGGNKAKKRARRQAAQLKQEKLALQKKTAFEEKQTAEKKQKMALGSRVRGRRGLLTALDDNSGAAL